MPHLISCIEWVCAVRTPSLHASFPVLLKHLYDADILTEDAILARMEGPIRGPTTHAKVSEEAATTLRAAAQPFVIWLKEAEETSSEDE